MFFSPENSVYSVHSVHTVKFPSNISEEAKFNLDLCLQYMEIIGI